MLRIHLSFKFGPFHENRGQDEIKNQLHSELIVNLQFAQPKRGKVMTKYADLC